MGQIITNTFFDDCEGIVNENGKPFWSIPEIEFDALSDGRQSMSVDEFLTRYGLSKALLDEPTKLLGIGVGTILRQSGLFGVASGTVVGVYTIRAEEGNQMGIPQMDESFIVADIWKEWYMHEISAKKLSVHISGQAVTVQIE